MFATSAVTPIHKVSAFSVLTSWPPINTRASFPLHTAEAQTELAGLVSRNTKAVWGRGEQMRLWSVVVDFLYVIYRDNKRATM